MFRACTDARDLPSTPPPGLAFLEYFALNNSAHIYMHTQYIVALFTHFNRSGSSKSVGVYM